MGGPCRRSIALHQIQRDGDNHAYGKSRYDFRRGMKTGRRFVRSGRRNELQVHMGSDQDERNHIVQDMVSERL